MPQIIKNECPCIGCKNLTFSNVSYEYWCKKKEQTVMQHRGNAFHRAGQWLIPCGRDMLGYEDASLLDRLAAEYDRKHPNGLKFTYSLDGEVQQTEQEEKENERI